MAVAMRDEAGTGATYATERGWVCRVEAVGPDHRGAGPQRTGGRGGRAREAGGDGQGAGGATRQGG
jgi:hypothetical protein